MSALADIRASGSRWIGEVAAALLAWRDALRPPRYARLIEQDDGGFLLEAAPPLRVRLADGALAPGEAARLAPHLARARLEIVLLPARFMFRPLQLPRRAADFLEAIVRSQIDRLTPWSAAEAAFGVRSDPADSGDRLNLTVAATARSLLAPFVDAARGFGVEAVRLSTPAPEGGATIAVLDQKIEGAVAAERLRRGLALLLAGLAVAAVAAVAAASIGGNEFETRQEAINHAIAERRAALRQGGDPSSAAALALQQKKRETPSAVLVYEELSRILPDDAYLTELHIEGDKAQIVGLARDPPELIRLLEKSPHFKAATFFAATTRTAAESAQHFFIEAHIVPVFPAAETINQ